MGRDDTATGELTTDLSTKLEPPTFVEPDTGELRELQRQGKDLAIEASVILFAHPEDRMLGTRFRLRPDRTLEIGRSSGCDLSMPGVRSLSRRHARLEHTGMMVQIEDMGSTNGTYVNDRRIGEAHRLRSGDRFQVGALHFKFLHERDPETAYHEAIYQLVTCDGLTRIYNKRKLEEELAREFPRAQRHRRPLSLVFFDIDHFKQVNDTHGHLCGDFVLQQIARLVQPFLRTEQVFARVGGEEFAILCPEMDQRGARLLAEKLRGRLSSERFTYADVDLRVTCSFGVAEMEPTMRRPEQLYDLADQAMYRSKREGRDRVSVGL
ncbi:MAG: GGDEF domain-containing protein [Acidobacteriota bacterium]